VKNIIYIFLILSIYSTQSLAWFWEEKNIEYYRNEFQASNKQVSEYRLKVYTELNQTKQMLLNFYKVKDNLDNVNYFNDLFDNHKSAKQEIEYLYQKFIESVKNADKYLLKIKEQTQQIANKERRHSEEIKNIKFEDAYIVRLQGVKKAIEKFNIANLLLKDTIIQLQLKVERADFNNKADNFFKPTKHLFQDLEEDFNSMDKLGQELLNEKF